MKTKFLIPLWAFLLLAPGWVSSAVNFAQTPLFINSTEPRIMLVASRDHELSKKAYTDYTDIDQNGTLDITYNDTINYYGYYDINKCYTYTSGRFVAASTATGLASPKNHQCSDQWSGNFMNWATMTRMDVLRKTFYGGYRSTDTTTETVLERQFLPTDVHAFAKVYNPGSNATIKLYVPASVINSSSTTAVTICNVSDSTLNTPLSGKMNIPPPSTSPLLPTPLIRVAAGSFPQWDSSEGSQCKLGASGSQIQPSALLGTYNARIKVCDTIGGVESNCKNYTNLAAAGAQIPKPVGLLQQYGDVDALRRVRFGLMTGSYAANKSGGVLRKNVGLLSNNNNTSPSNVAICGNNNANDEIDVCTGQFINQESTKAGIINTLNRLHIAGFEFSSTTGGAGIHRYNCDSPGIASFTDGKCVDWGNPLSEIYLESLRYFANAGPTAAFNVSDANILSSIPSVSWTDPLPSTQWCAVSNIVVLSTGLNSFDTDQLAAFTPTGGTAINASTLTQTVGDASHENINGGNYLIGSNGTDNNNQCTSKSVANLANAKGICPEVPSIQGGYGLAGLAYAPKTIDLRPGYSALRDERWGGITNAINSDWALRQPLDTYTVQLAETLPSFTVNVNSKPVTILPACQSTNNGSATAWTPTSSGWNNCSMTNLYVDANVTTAQVGTDSTARTKTCSGDGTLSRCFTIAWEDSTWGNDYDMDAVQRLGYCVGASCTTFKMVCPSTSSANATIGPYSDPGTGKIRVATCVLGASIGFSMTLGYTVTGTTADGVSFPILQNSAFYNVGSVLTSATPANQVIFTTGTSAAKQLKNPLWYAAKYGGFEETNPDVGTPNPNLLQEWDIQNNFTGVGGSDGEPDNYFNVRNPANLITALGRVFDRAAQKTGAAASAATNSSTILAQSRVYQAKFSPSDWSGQLIASRLTRKPTGEFELLPEWDAGDIINTQSSRTIITKGATGDGAAFDYANLTGPTATLGTQQNLLDKNYAGITDNCGANRVFYLRGISTNEGPANQKFFCLSPSTSQIAKFRERPTSKLGDMINSNPVYVGAPLAGYSDIEQPGYSAFRTSKLGRKPVVYVGANDGMLHGFDASLDFPPSNPEGIVTATSGQEVLAFVPTQVYPNLSKLTDQTYNKNHLYFVDSSPMAGDIDIDSSAANNWRTILVGALGAGGKGFYALDITDPATFSESSSAPANTFLWEFDETDMGNAVNLSTINQASQAKQIVKMANGKWAVIVGNGYNSVAGKAVLYVLFIEHGVDGVWAASDYVKIVAEAPVAPATNANNGLSTPTPFDTNDDGFADTVYAGDLKGRMWKFLVGPNVSDASVTSSPSSWKVAFSGNPLFNAVSSASVIQPIIVPPEVIFHPNGGQLILFGTGKYLESADINDTAGQTFYAIWDKDNGTTTVGTRTADLLQQVISPLAGFPKLRVGTVNNINWRTGPPYAINPANCTPVTTDPLTSCNPSHLGWYIDLPTSKERTTGIPRVISEIIVFNTLIPSEAPCDAGGTGWLMAVDAFSGGQVGPTFDTNGNSHVDGDDTATVGLKVGATVGGTTIITDDSGGAGFGTGGGDSGGGSGSTTDSVGITTKTDGSSEEDPIKFPKRRIGRLNWREIIQ